MKWIDGIHAFPKHIKQFILFFVLALSFGYFTGFKFIVRTTNLNPSGLEENYVGNEENEEAEILKFKKAEGELITTIHTHILSFSLIFFALGFVLLSVPMSLSFKKFLLIEPFISIVVTFGGVWLLWLGYSWLKYIVMISGMLITLTFVLQVAMIIRGVASKN
ncbi:MAG: hypothetical protein OEW67_11335 [Cyclobacteriaceae bacterium]|nr:hypothetical protein [Cyclobacteriaceae bacterium]